jgi:hypothetical protein
LPVKDVFWESETLSEAVNLSSVSVIAVRYLCTMACAGNICRNSRSLIPLLGVKQRWAPFVTGGLLGLGEKCPRGAFAATKVQVGHGLR